MTPRVQTSTRGPSYFDFRGKVLESAPELVQLLPCPESGAQAEVQEFDVASGIPQDVLCVQIQVLNTFLSLTRNLPERFLGLSYMPSASRMRRHSCTRLHAP